MPSSLDAILKPRTVAVIGASRSPKHIGHQITANLIQHGSRPATRTPGGALQAVLDDGLTGCAAHPAGELAAR